MNLNRRLLSLARRPIAWLALTVALGLLGGGLIVLQAALLASVLDAVFLQGAGLTAVRPILLTLVAVLLLRAAAAWGCEVAAFHFAAQIKRTLRRRLLDHLLALGPVHLSGERTGEITNALTEGLEELETYFRRYLPQVVLTALVPLLVLIVVFPRDWISGLILLITAPVIPLFMNLIGSLADALTRTQWQQLNRMSAFLLDALQGLTALKVLGRSREYVRRVEAVSDRFRRTTLQVLRIAFLSALVLEWAGTLSTAVVAVGIGLRLLYGHLTFSQAFLVLLLAPEFYQPFRLLGTRFHAGMGGVAAAERLFALLDLPVPHPRGDAVATEVPSRPSPSPHRVAGLRESLSPPRMHLVLEQVTYTYPEARTPALEDLSLVIAENQITALVGPSGAGKSTVAALLLRFIVPQAGRILVDGRPLSDYPPQMWRRWVAWVPQRPYLFNATVEENLRLARPDVSWDEMVEAARLARADAFIRALPQSYKTPLGEQGVRLSGGQAQRLALARALLKNAPLLILDEPTASLDPEQEAAVQAALERLLAHRTVLVIAHRLNTVVRAHRIVVLHHGRVVQEGTHGTLLAQEGLYRRLVGAYRPAPQETAR